MPKVKDIETLNIDDVQYKVADMPPEVQELVEIYNDWNRKAADARDQLTIMQAAMQTLSNQIIAKVKEALEPPAPETTAPPPAEEGEAAAE